MLPDQSEFGQMPKIIGLCPEHREEFYVPHAGYCPECSRVLVEYVPVAPQPASDEGER